MPRVAVIAVVLLALIAPQLAFSPTASSQDAESVATVAKPSVAAIVTERPEGIFSGTGFMAADRLVLTAYHIVEGARRILLKFPDYPVVEARFVSGNRNDDVAVLGIPALPIRPLPLGDVSQVREGQTIVVIGFPRIESLGAQTPTVTQGIISAVRPGLLQMQAPVSPGNSGGPVLTVRGEVVGIVNSTLRGEQQGINFATPINAAKPLLGAAIVGPPSSPPPPSPAPLPSQPPSVSGGAPLPASSDPFEIVPGRGIGSVRLGMHVEEVVPFIGSHKSTKVWPDGSVSYYWFEPPQNAGLALRATRTGTLYQIWAQNDTRYFTTARIRPGSTEAEARAVFGEPSRFEHNAPDKLDALWYDRLGLVITINRNATYTFYNVVFQIGVLEPK